MDWKPAAILIMVWIASAVIVWGSSRSHADRHPDATKAAIILAPLVIVLGLIAAAVAIVFKDA